MELEKLVGQRLVIGIPGTRITPEIVRHFKELNVGGLILYRINFESPSQLKKLISDLEETLGRKLLVMADHEGGRVIMFREGITVFPDNLAIGTAGKIEYAQKQGEIEAKELRRLGIDVNLAPVLDVLTDSYSPNIGIRSYGKECHLVSEMGAARIIAMQKGGLSACAKHFPGKGHAPVDAHLGLPVIQSTWAEMEALHLKPFVKVIESGVDIVMSSHPYYPNLDSEPKMIATFSKKIIRDYLRSHLDFKGVISSDDLEMGAIKEICDIGEAAIRATEAGHDILLVCHDLEAQRKVYNSLLNAYKENRLSINDLEKSVERVENLKSKRKQRFESGEPQMEPDGTELVKRICQESVTILKGESHLKSIKFTEEDATGLPVVSGAVLRQGRSGDPSRMDGIPLPMKNKEAGKGRPLTGKKTAVIFPRFSFLDDKIMIEKEVLNEEKFVLQRFAEFNVKPKVQIVSIEPTDEEIVKVSKLIKKSDTVIYFCFDAHLYPSNKRLLDIVQQSDKEIFVVLLRDPYDVEYVKNGVVCLADFGWRACQIKAVIERIFS